MINYYGGSLPMTVSGSDPTKLMSGKAGRARDESYRTDAFAYGGDDELFWEESKSDNMFMSPSMLKSGGITDRIANITKTGKATLVKDPKSGKVALVIPKVSNTSYNLDCTFHGYESGVLLYKKNINGAVLEGEASALWNKTEFYTYLNGLKVGIYTEDESSNATLSKGNSSKTDKFFGGGPETHNYYCSYDGQGNVAQVSNMAGDEPYSLYAYDSYGTQTGSDYSSESFSSYKGYDKGPFGYKTGVRQYDPETGRFLSPDAFKGYITDPASQHPYMYCHGNPVKFSDPSGYESFIFYNTPAKGGEAGMHRLIAETYKREHLPGATIKMISSPTDIEKFVKGKSIDYLVLIGHGSPGVFYTDMRPNISEDRFESGDVAGMNLKFKKMGKPELPRVQIYACDSAVSPGSGMSIAQAFSKRFRISARGLLSTGGYSGVEFGLPNQNLPAPVPSNFKGVYMVPENRAGANGFRTFYP